MDPVVALKDLTSAMSTLNTLSTMVGGNQILSVLCGVDVDYVYNTMILQEQQLNIRIYSL